MEIPAWCKPTDYKKGLRVKCVFDGSKTYGEKGTLKKYAETSMSGDCWFVNWDNKKRFLSPNIRFWVGWLKIIKPETLKDLIK